MIYFLFLIFDGFIKLFVLFYNILNLREDDCKMVYLDFIRYFKSGIGQDKFLESFGQLAVMSYIFLEAGNPVGAKNEPKFQGSKSPTERDLPMSIIYRTLKSVL